MVTTGDVEERAAEYLAEYGWCRMDVGISLMKFEEVFGAEAVAKIGRFIDWAETHDQASIIAGTIAHDLSKFDHLCFSPRTSSY